MSTVSEKKSRAIPSFSTLCDLDNPDDAEFTLTIKTSDYDIAKGVANYASQLFRAKRKKNTVLPGQMGLFENVNTD